MEENQSQLSQNPGDFFNASRLGKIRLYIPSKNIDVAILGTSPAGLTLAVHLLRGGVYPHIIDDGYEESLVEKDPDQPIFLSVRCLEMFRQVGLSDVILQQGREIRDVHFYSGMMGSPFQQETYLGAIKDSPSELGASVFAFPVVLSLKELRKILIDYLAKHACKISWDARCLTYHQQEKEVDLSVSSGSELEKWKARYLVLTHDHPLQGLEWKIEKSQETWSWADVTFPDKSFNEESGFHLEVEHPTVLGLAPSSEKGKGRLYFRTGLRHFPIPHGWKIEAKQVVSGAFKLGTSVLDRNIIRIGEGQIQATPFIGFLCSHSLQDAWNLGWKLARTLTSSPSKALLNSFLEERGAITNELFQQHLSKLKAYSSGGWIHQRLAAFRIRRYLKKLGNKPAYIKQQKAFWNQQNVDYRFSKLSVHHSRTESCQAGDRIPYFVIFDEKQKIQTDTHSWFSKPGFMIWILGSVSQHNLHAITQWIKQKYPHDLSLFYLPYSSRNHTIFDYFQMKEEDSQVLIVRPDMHIAYMCNHIHMGLIDNYLKTVIGFAQVK